MRVSLCSLQIIALKLVCRFGYCLQNLPLYFEVFLLSVTIRPYCCVLVCFLCNKWLLYLLWFSSCSRMSVSRRFSLNHSLNMLTNLNASLSEVSISVPLLEARVRSAKASSIIHTQCFFKHSYYSNSEQASLSQVSACATTPIGHKSFHEPLGLYG